MSVDQRAKSSGNSSRFFFFPIKVILLLLPKYLQKFQHIQLFLEDSKIWVFYFIFVLRWNVWLTKYDATITTRCCWWTWKSDGWIRWKVKLSFNKTNDDIIIFAVLIGLDVLEMCKCCRYSSTNVTNRLKKITRFFHRVSEMMKMNLIHRRFSMRWKGLSEKAIMFHFDEPNLRIIS